MTINRNYIFFSIILLLFFFINCPESEYEAEENNEINYSNKGKIILKTTSDYNWCFYVPNSIKKNDTCYILLEVSHPQIQDYDELTIQAKTQIQNLISISEQNKYIIITPVIPRDFINNYYPQGINYYSFQVSTPSFYYRPDIKVNVIINELFSELNNIGYMVKDKIFVAGFSAGGMWANKYTLLHPEKVKACVIGQAGGWLSLPISSYNSNNLNWPMGLNDYLTLTGEEYTKQNLLKSVPMFVYIGDQDNSNTYTAVYPQITDINIWGTTDPSRLENQSIFLINTGYDVIFKSYPGIAHTLTDDMMTDINNFLNSNK